MSNQSSGIQFARELQQIKQQMPLHVEALIMDADLKHKYFRALIKSGFTEKQALEIVKAKVQGGM
jgi:SOS response regulatory protein OraA/RecX